MFWYNCKRNTTSAIFIYPYMLLSTRTMPLAFVASLFYLYFLLCSAYDNFQGLGKLERACFPVYEHEECNVTLEEIYDPPIKGATRNPPTTKLFLFTPTSPDKAEQLHECGGGLPAQTTFDVNCPTEIFIHGYSDGVCRTAWMREMKEQLFLRSNYYNVILVDWTWGNLPDIASAASDAKVAGQQVAYVLKKIARQIEYDCRKFHVVANSYGVIAASYTGKFMQEKTCRLGRLTSLDDALPPLKYASEEERLNPTDALLVDAIYTNGGDCFPFNIGDPRAMGHVNFYVNDGIHQYSCYPYALESFLKLDIFYAIASIVYPALCFHVQSIQYYKASIIAGIDNTLLIGVQCESDEDWPNGDCVRDCKIEGNCLPMGLDTSSYVDYRNLSTDSSKKLIYHVPTTLTCPYADHSGFTGLPLKKVSDQEPPI